MILLKWLVKNKIKVVKFAADLDIGVASVYRYLKGERMHATTAEKIIQYTRNEVTREDLLNK